MNKVVAKYMDPVDLDLHMLCPGLSPCSHPGNLGAMHYAVGVSVAFLSDGGVSKYLSMQEIFKIGAQHFYLQ